jgi:hypothetical protein
VDESYAGQQVVGLDLHRRRTVMVRMTPAGERLEAVRFASDPAVLAEQIAWYWVADVLDEAGARLHLAHPFRGEGLCLPAGEKRLSRRRGPGGSAADGSTARGVDRA